tara:strand:+ start:4355 stop:4930 length:576 start_codon:yes stop_codon:yes gene_type:complete
MAFFFRPFPKIFYDVKKNNNNSSVLTNITARYKIRDILKQRAAIFYDYTVKEGDTPSSVAFRYYEDETLDWLILLVNDIIDPYYDWPLSYNTFIEFIKSLYGSVDTAMATTYEYRQILNSQSHLIDGTVIPERTVVVDQNTYNSLAPANRKLIDAYEYYEEQNNLKRNIKLLDKRYLGSILTEVETIFSSS